MNASEAPPVPRLGLGLMTQSNNRVFSGYKLHRLYNNKPIPLMASTQSIYIYMLPWDKEETVKFE